MTNQIGPCSCGFCDRPNDGPEPCEFCNDDSAISIHEPGNTVLELCRECARQYIGEGVLDYDRTFVRVDSDTFRMEER